VLPVARKLEAIADRLNRAMIEVSEKIAEKVVEKMAGRMPQPKAVQAEKPTNYKPLLIWIGCMLGGILLALGWLIVR
jgi:H+/gluconate symporter-like permease